jgi:hypothetical protein
MRVVVTGARDWEDEELIYEALAGLEAPVTIIEGDCRGADRLARKVAVSLGYDVHTLPASWEVNEDTPRWAIRHYNGHAYDVRAGAARNTEMLDLRPELVIAFHDDPQTGGTRDCMDQALKRGIPVIHVAKQSVTFLTGATAPLVDRDQVE